ncbi:hypothetical protein HQ531_13415 [bacterium]|nr:hypothetical protein [bacterium]
MITNKTHKTLLAALILLISVSTLWAQPKAPPMLDPRRFDAWTVEYEPFRLLIENAVEEYITLNETDLPPIASSDNVIAVRSKSGQRSLYQIRYGTVSDGFNVIDNMEVKWVLGGTLASTIADKEKYYHLDTQEPFETTEHQPEIDYLEVESFWTHTDLQIGADRLVYLFGKSGGITVEWGNELFGRPYGEAGFARFGVITPLFKLGVQVPSPSVPLGYRDGESDQILTGGIGMFGAFKYKVLYGELFFQSLEKAFVSENDPQINSYDLGILTNLSFNTTLSGFKMGSSRLLAGALQIRLGGVVARVDHSQTVGGVLSFQDHTSEWTNTEPTENTYGGKASTEDSGVFFRVDYSSPLIEKRFPRHEAVIQLSGPSIMAKYTYNLNHGLGIPLTILSYTKENDWTPGIAVLVGFKLRLDQN